MMQALINLQLKIRQDKLRTAYRTRDGTIPPGLTPIEQVGLRVILERDARDARLDRYIQALRNR